MIAPVMQSARRRTPLIIPTLLPPVFSSPVFSSQMLSRIVSSRVTWIVILALIGGFFRVVAVRDTHIPVPIRADAAEYYLTAYNVAHNGIYSRSAGKLATPPVEVTPDSYRAPGLPLLITPFMHLWPNHAAIIQRVLIINVALGVATVVGIFLCAAAALPLPAAITVGLLTAGSPHLISLTTYLLSETPAAFLVVLLLGVTALGLPQQHPKSLMLAINGMIIGLLSFFRPIFLGFGPVMPLVFPGRTSKLRALVLGCIGIGVIVGPWMVRNALNVPPGSSQNYMVAPLVGATYRGYVYRGNPATFPYAWTHDPQFDALQQNLATALPHIAKTIAADPTLGMLRWYFVEKQVYLFQWSNIDGAGDIFVYPARASPFRDNPVFVVGRALFFYTHEAILFLAALGCVLAWTRGGPRSRGEAGQLYCAWRAHS